MKKVLYNGRMRTLHSGSRGGHYVISSGRKVYLKVKSSSKKTGPKKKTSSALKKKSGPKKKTGSKKKTGPKKKMYIPRISNLKKFKLFRGGGEEEVAKGKKLFEGIISAANSVRNTGNKQKYDAEKRRACEKKYMNSPLPDILNIFEYLATTEPYKYITVLFTDQTDGKILARHWGGDRSGWLKNEGENVDSLNPKRKRILDEIVRIRLESSNKLFNITNKEISNEFKIG